MIVIEPSLEICTAPDRHDLDPRLERREQLSDDAKARGFSVASLDGRHLRLRHAGSHDQIDLPPTPWPAKCTQDATHDDVVHGDDRDVAPLVADHSPMDHADHVALIRAGIAGAGMNWLELGAGEGAFTLALADVLGPGGRILASDRDPLVLHQLEARVRRAFPDTGLESRAVDFTNGLPSGPFDGVLAANCLHFVHDRRRLLAEIRAVLRPGGPLVLVEYDADSGNPWVPYPFSFGTWLSQAVAAGFGEPRLLHRVPSRFLDAIYGAVAVPAADHLLHSRPHGGDREE